MKGQNRVIIENIHPEINHGKYPVKRVINDKIDVMADIFCDGIDMISAEVMYKHQDDTEWSYSGMEMQVNDNWKGSFTLNKEGKYLYTIRAWADHFKTWHRDLLKKIEIGVESALDFALGSELVRDVINEYKYVSPEHLSLLNHVSEIFSSEKGNSDKMVPVVNGELFNVMILYPLRRYVTWYGFELSALCERKKAGFSSWYELFPRSVSNSGNRHGTFKDCIDRLPYIAEMGFDILYLPPVHPIGKSNRKGKNNTITSEPGDVGSPWAIGSENGGHKSLHPDLGTFEDFANLVKEAGKLNIEVALDIAFQCSPDHPYLKEHPEWFRHLPDGSVKHAENPPKKYEDIVPFDFETEAWESLWEELKSIFHFWIDKGIKIFRVDNPHTKSLRFWGWVINEIKETHPETIFLAEAFTRSKVMYQLAKRGFTQSYTYFTWRNTKHELTSYFNELINTDVKEYFRPNLWPNTPDILPEFLQVTGRPGFIIRLILAATLGSNYGIYGPAFELMENEATEPGSEEYLNSEKYEIRQRNLRIKESLKSLIARINKIRYENEALQNNHSLSFHHIDNENLISYSKHTDDYSNIVLVVVNLDPNHTHSGWVNFLADEFITTGNRSYQVHDLLANSFYLWNGNTNYVEINPGIVPAHIFRVRRKVRTERDFDYFM